MKLLESKIIRLVEERGYMGTKYIHVIKKIINFVENYIDEHSKNIDEGWEIYIPDNLTQQIDCVDTLMIKVTIKDSDEGFRFTGSGSNTLFYNNQIINGKLALGEIKINGYSSGTYLHTRTIFNSLSHELNHVLEYYEKLLKKQKSQTIFKKTATQNDILDKKFSENNNINIYIKNIFYRLLYKSEFNALINGVYGDLEGLNSIRKNFKKDLKLTQAYSVYYDFITNIWLLDNLSDNEWDNIMECYNLNSSDTTKHSVNVKSFKIKFKRLVESKLNELMKGIGKIASYYYDSKEDIEPTEESLEIKDPNMILNDF